MAVYLDILQTILSSGFSLGGLAINAVNLPAFQFLTAGSSPPATTASKTAESVNWSSLLDNANTVVGILLSIVTGVSIILGLHYLRSLKEKHTAATFTFWSQINMRIIRLYNLLKAEKGLLNNMYPRESRFDWETNSPEPKRVSDFKDLVQETLEYLKQVTDQMPAYVGWSNDFTNFIIFLSDVIQYDICDEGGKFIENNMKPICNRDEYWKNTCEVMTRLMDGIKHRQTTVEAEICRETWVKRQPKRFKA